MKKAIRLNLIKRNDQLEILVFRHPLSGVQLVKGTTESGESSLEGAERELQEEAGITLSAEHQLLEWQRYPGEPIWAICLMESGDDLPDKWSHYCHDDGGHMFQFFWYQLRESPDSEWHPVFVDALDVIRKVLVS